jgi:hypothetical protein
MTGYLIIYSLVMACIWQLIRKGMAFGEVYETPLDEYDVARVGARYYQVTDTLLTQELISI